MVAADIADTSVAEADQDDTASPGQVRLTPPSVPAHQVAALLVDADTQATTALVRAAAAAVTAADDGDEAAEAVVAAVDDADLLWFDPAEIPDLVAPVA